jgi:hypothetical protein
LLLTKLTVSNWIKKTVKYAYVNSTDEDRVVTQIRAHDVRGFATSWAFSNSVPLVEVLRAGTWKNHSTFSEYYLKDVSTLKDAMLSLVTLSVAQQRV